MKRLKLLGGAAIEATENGGGALKGRAVQRRRIALLALLALRHPSGLSRDKLIAYLWPDADGERGRALLSDSIYRINQEIEEETIEAAGDELRLSTRALECDAIQFTHAMEQKDYARAVAVYGGPLLDGFFLSECVELERWIEQERARLGRDYQSALEALAEAATAAGQHSQAADCWRKVATLDPYDSRAALRLMQALAAAGNRAGALQHASVHSALVKSDFGTEPDRAVVEFAEQLRRGERDAPAPVAQRASAAVPVESMVQPAPQPATAQTRPRRRWYAPVVAALLLLVIAAVFASRLTTHSDAGADPDDRTRSIAVLPFTNIGGDASEEYFADGMTEELIAALDRIEGLRVASRTSAFMYKGKPSDIRDVAERLGVNSVVEGSVRREGRRLRVSARLIDATNGYRLWSDDYDAELRDVLDVQASIARAIATALRRRVVDTRDEQLREDLSRDPQAYDLYLKGRFAWHRRTEQSLREAREYFEAAVARVPGYARAWAGLADALAVAAFYDYIRPRDGFPRAETAARRALALDSTLAAPYATLGYVNLYYHWNWPRAEADFRRAIRLAPEYSTAHQWYGNLLTAMGRHDEARAAFERATETDPLSLIAMAASGWSRWHAGAFDEAELHFTRTLEMDPRYQLAHLWRGQAALSRGRHEAGLASLSRAVQLAEGNSLTLAALAHGLAVAGRRDSARRVIAAVERRAPGQYIPPYEVAKVHLALGDTARAMRWLERAFTERAHSMVFLRVDPHLAGMERHPSYAALLRRVGL